jgi:hypothetical protein
VGTLLIVVVYLAVYYTAWAVAGRFRSLRTDSTWWLVGFGLAPFVGFFLGFLSPVLWVLAMFGLAGYVVFRAGRELRMRQDYLERIGYSRSE